MYKFLHCFTGYHYNNEIGQQLYNDLLSPLRTNQTKTIMTRHCLLAMALVAMLATSCSTTSFTEYRGEGVIEGKGGTIRVVEGIDFWENGEPDRKYRILGVIDDLRGEGLISRRGKDEAIAKVARKHGGEAVILSGTTREFRGVNLDSGAARYKRITKLVVVKYVP